MQGHALIWTLAAGFLCSACAGIAPIAGSSVLEASFGEATTSNHLTQAAYLNSEARLINMNTRFRAEAPITVNFAFDRARLDSEARAALRRQAKWLKGNADVRVHIFGHTDLVGGDSYNNRLGLRRARAAARYLIAKGVPRSRIDVVESRGEREPVVQTEGRERRNRRTVTEVIGFVRGFVGDDMDGKRALLMYSRYVSDSVDTPEGTGVQSSGGGG